jgi:hypothetical protein
MPKIINQEQAADIKESLQKEINKMLLNNENVMAVKEVNEKQGKRVKHQK